MQIEDHSGSSSVPLEVTRQIDALCDEFEQQLGSGDGVAFATLVERVDEAGRSELLGELAVLALEHLEGQGESHPSDELIAANAALATELRELCNEHAATADQVAPRASEGKASGRLQVTCPKCTKPFHLAVEADLDELECTHCGASLQLGGTHGATPWIAHFQLRERVGMGTFGAVWRAIDTRLDRLVAVKIPRGAAYDDRQKRAFVREAQSAAALSHPGIVPIYEASWVGETLFIVSEYVSGGTLAESLSRERPRIRDAARMAVQIADALQHAHDRGVIHRDLKPGNIMLDESGNPRLTDFGLARRETPDGTKSADGQLLGSPAYMSPEQARADSRSTDARSDLYALGVLLFELTTGELPFRGQRWRLLDQVIHDDPPRPCKFNSGVPPDLETIILRALEKSPERRFQSATAFAEELGRFLRGEPIESRPAGRVERAIRWCRRHKAQAAIGGLAAVLAIAVAAWGVREAAMSQQLRLQLSDNLLQEAELLGRQGRWTEAAGKLEEAEQFGIRDRVGYLLQELRTHEALNDAERARELIDELNSRWDLGDRIGQVRLAEGLALLIEGGLGQAEPLLREALALGNLPIGREELVRGLLAPTSAEAIELMARSVELNPYDQIARYFSVLLLTSTGRFDEARDEGKAARLLFPSDPNFPAMLATLAEMDDRPQDIEAILGSPAMRQHGDDLIERYRLSLRAKNTARRNVHATWDFAHAKGFIPEDWRPIDAGQPLFRQPSRPDTLPSFEQREAVRTQTRAAGRVVRYDFMTSPNMLAAATNPWWGPKCLDIAYAPVLAVFADRTQGFIHHGRGSVDRIDRLIGELAESEEAHPDGFLVCVRAQLLFVRGRLREAAEAFEQAATMHAQFGTFQGEAMFGATRCWYEVYRRGDEGAKQRTAGWLNRRLDAGDFEDHHADALFRIARELGQPAAAERLLSHLEASGLDPAECLLRRAEVAEMRGEPAAALRLAQLVPAGTPQHDLAKRIIARSRSSLAELVRDDAANRAGR